MILRVGWETRFSLEEIRECRADPEAMNGAIRLMGSGGLFAIAGIFRNRRLGTFRAYATEPENAVVISTSDKTLVITPADPRLFISALLDAKRPPER